MSFYTKIQNASFLNFENNPLIRHRSRNNASQDVKIVAFSFRGYLTQKVKIDQVFNFTGTNSQVESKFTSHLSHNPLQKKLYSATPLFHSKSNREKKNT